MTVCVGVVQFTATGVPDGVGLTTGVALMCGVGLAIGELLGTGVGVALPLLIGATAVPEVLLQAVIATTVPQKAKMAPPVRRFFIRKFTTIAPF
jgi:hypothetical protein